ncbi:MAG TPA: RES family NAD+ phosphorylase, partial [Chthoniobacteraceae bacterium]|nr:RES family NAD+ phosphorylase [Chthoniobacteraceae bacterium]
MREARAPEAFTGKAAQQYGGRWNSPGVAVVYTSAHQSLAALEILVHLQPRGALRFVAFAVEFDEEFIETISATTLAPQWRAEPPGAATMGIG